MNVAVIKYNAGNIRSVDYALKRLGVEAVITADKEVLQAADKVIFPGVGEAETTMKHLRASRMDELIKNLRQPVLGICLGMQLMCRFSEIPTGRKAIHSHPRSFAETAIRYLYEKAGGAARALTVRYGSAVNGTRSKESWDVLTAIWRKKR